MYSCVWLLKKSSFWPPFKLIVCWLETGHNQVGKLHAAAAVVDQLCGKFPAAPGSCGLGDVTLAVELAAPNPVFRKIAKFPSHFCETLPT